MSAMQPTAVDAKNALDRARSLIVGRCTSASANRALTNTHSTTCTAVAAAPIPSSDGPMMRAMVNDARIDKTADEMASMPDQRASRFMPGAGALCQPLLALTQRPHLWRHFRGGEPLVRSGGPVRHDKH